MLDDLSQSDFLGSDPDNIIFVNPQRLPKAEKATSCETLKRQKELAFARELKELGVTKEEYLALSGDGTFQNILG